MSIQLTVENTSSEIDSYQPRPLVGKYFLITRDVKGNSAEREKLECLGARILELEAVKISPPSSWEQLDSALSTLHRIDWVIFTSGNGVRFFFERFSQITQKNNSKCAQSRLPKFACIGSATVRALESQGFACSFQPSRFLTKILGEEFVASFSILGKRILLARVENASSELGDILRKAGAEVVEVPVYALALGGQQLSAQDLSSITDITLMSPSAVEGLQRAISSTGFLKREIRVHCIGPVTARAAENAGLEVFSVSVVHTLNGLIQTIVDEKR